MKKNVCVKILVIILMLLGILIISPEIYASSLEEISTSNSESVLDGSSSASGTIQNLSSQVVGMAVGISIVIGAIMFIIVGCIILVPLIRLIYIKNNKKKYEVEKSARKARNGIVIILVLYALSTILSIIGSLGGNGDISIITSILVTIVVSILLILAYKEYKVNIRKAMKLEKFAILILIINLCLSIVVAAIVLGINNATSVAIFIGAIGVTLLTGLFIPLFLLGDMARVSKSLNQEKESEKLNEFGQSVISDNQEFEENQNKKIIMYVIAVLVLACNSIIPGVMLNEKMKQAANFEAFLENFNNSNALKENNQSDEELFDKAQNAATEYENHRQEEVEMTNNLINQLNNFIQSNNTVNNNYISNNVNSNNVFNNEIVLNNNVSTNNGINNEVVINNNVVSNNAMNNEITSNTIISNNDPVNEGSITNNLIIGNTINNQNSFNNISLTNELGDINMDGRLSMSDMALLKNHITKKSLLEGEQYLYADLNSDNNITMSDLAKMKLKIIGIQE